jgi:hypothetical protein
MLGTAKVLPCDAAHFVLRFQLVATDAMHQSILVHAAAQPLHESSLHAVVNSDGHSKCLRSIPALLPT